MVNQQVSPDHYDFLAYERAARYSSYYYQIKTILENGIRTVMEVGTGSGLFYRIVRSMGVDVRTMDVDRELKPDVVADIRDIPLPDSSIECVCAFQVLEHIPFSESLNALAELKRVSSHFVFFSIPDAGRYVKMDMKLPVIGRRKHLLQFNWLSRPQHAFDGQHYWEVNAKGYSEERLRRLFSCDKWVIKNEVRLFENPYHRFYLLQKRQ